MIIDTNRKRRRRRRRKARDKVLKQPIRNLAPFFYTTAWKQVRYLVLKRDGGRCLACGRSARDGCVMNVDHIKPRLKYPELALDPDNLQTLCSSCNWGKGGRDETDWRCPELDEAFLNAMHDDARS